MNSCVIDDGKVSGECLVNCVKGDDIARTDFGLELGLAGAEESFDQAARSRVAWRSVDEFHAKVITGRA